MDTKESTKQTTNGFVRNIPNMITSVRIIGALMMLFLKPLSTEFFIVYGVCGFTDAVDGFIARTFRLQSKFGSVLDSISDLVFFGVLAIMIIPVLIELLPVWNWALFIIPFLLQSLGYIVCAFKFKKFSSLHTYSNKALGACVFLYPFSFIGLNSAVYETFTILLGIVAFYASIETNLIHIVSKKYDERNKSVFIALKRRKEDSEAESL